MTQNVKKSRRFSLTPGTCGALLLLALGGLLATAGCSSEDCKGDDCKTCSDSDCSEGQRCVQNECRNACTTNQDCSSGQVCHGYQFRAGDEGTYCVVLPGSGGSGAGPNDGRFTPCDDSSQCDEPHGFACIDGECSYECSSHADCVEVGHCDSRTVDGKRRQFCVRDETPPKPGELYTSCPQGDECQEAALCIGAGPGDLDAYCSIGCERDADCATGYSCGSITRAPCEDACGFQGQPNDPRCVSADQIGDDQPWQCSEQGIVRSVCRKREFCASCESDADCLGQPNQVCARDKSGAKICTRLCDFGARSCPWGNAAECDVFDEELGLSTCSHRFGSCHGEGQTCEPCTSDADCPNGLCAASQFTGERWCINLGTTCDCMGNVEATGLCSNAGCPDSPGGLAIKCIGEPSSTLFNVCYAANSGGSGVLGASPQTGCWGAD